MEVLLTHCAALDVHKARIQACRLTRDGNGKPVLEERKFTTFTADILALRDWLQQAQVTHVALESTGSYWRPIYNLLEGHFELLLVNPHHVKNVPGRKTDVKDARWLVQLLQHGLVRPSFIPPEKQRALRDLTRTRTSFVDEKTRLINRIQKTLEDANIKLACVASDVVGVSGRAMLQALIGGHNDPAELGQTRHCCSQPQSNKTKSLRSAHQNHFLRLNLRCSKNRKQSRSTSLREILRAVTASG